MCPCGQYGCPAAHALHPEGASESHPPWRHCWKAWLCWSEACRKVTSRSVAEGGPAPLPQEPAREQCQDEIQNKSTWGLQVCGQPTSAVHAHGPECHSIAGECGNLRVLEWPLVSKGALVGGYSGPSIKRMCSRSCLQSSSHKQNTLMFKQVKPGGSQENSVCTLAFLQREGCLLCLLHPRPFPCLSNLHPKEGPVPK